MNACLLDQRDLEVTQQPTIEKHSPERTSVFPYCQNPALLVQFFLSEYLRCHALLAELNNCDFAGPLTLIEEQGHKLLGVHLHQPFYPKVFSTHLFDGSLNRLRHYAYMLTREERLPKNVKVHALYRQIDRLFRTAVSLQDRLVYAQHPQKRFSPVKLAEQLKQLAERLINQFDDVRQFFLPLLLAFRNDENVLYFLVRHHREFYALYQRNFVLQLFNRMYPDGIREGHRLLLERYRSRGFSELLPIIDEKITALEHLSQ